MQPEYFMVAPENQIFFSEANYAVLFTTVETAQHIAGRPGVNDVVLTLADGADPLVVADEAVAAIDATLGVGAEAQLISDNTGYRALTEDVSNDQQVFNLFAFLLLGGAVAGAFNLVNRLVERQRREIGAAMALGARPLTIAIRPLLVGAQIALLGVAIGIVVGLLIGAAMRSVFVDLLPLPIWRTPFQADVFAGAAGFGFLVPFGAAAWPVWRAVRVRPVEAIRPIHLTGGHRGATKRGIRRLHIPGDTFARMPFRNLGRAKRRTATTLLAVAAVIVVLVGFLGTADSAYSTLDGAKTETLQEAPDRLVVDLDGFHAIDSPEVRAILDAPSVGEAAPGVRVGAAATVGDTGMPLLIELIDFDTAVWTPTITKGSAFDRGLILSEKAATDLGVGVGDAVMLRFPFRTGPDTFALRAAQMPVAGLHPYPLRPFAYMSLGESDGFGLQGDVNLLNVLPAPGADAADVKRDLLDAEAVVAVQPVATIMDSVEEGLGAITGILGVLGFAVFVLALLIAFNSASINLDERFRDHATMFAYGVRVRTALRMAMIESLIVGVTATAIGIAGGIGMVWWVTSQLLAETIPDLGISVTLEPSTLLLVVVLGVVAVAVAPIFTVRRMRRMDLPGTLRLME
ncbi:MAG: FtsX-like permease family protein, partial [Actinobacteria bacterium]|nr:FtsX-like permease family protein [Actinomycetota bacterium]